MPFGKIVDLHLSDGFAFITYESVAESTEAVQALNGVTLYKSKISVEFSKGR